jgi:hypothetical protein
MRLKIFAPACLGLLASIAWIAVNFDLNSMSSLGTSDGLESFAFLTVQGLGLLVLGVLLQFLVEAKEDDWALARLLSIR